jgi:hypothetical protein
LDADEQDRVNAFHLQLAADQTRGIKAKWKDIIGIPIFRWINRAFAREWDNLRAGKTKDAMRHVPISTVPNNEDDDDDEASYRNKIDAEISTGDYVEPQEPDVEREKQERALVWNEDHQAWVRQNETWLHPGHKVGRPLWEILRAIRSESEYHEIIVDSMVELGRVDYSKITRKLNEAGITVSHDKVNRDTKKIEGRLAVVHDSDENKRSKRNTYSNILPDTPTIKIPDQKQHEEHQAKQLSWDEREAANKKWEGTRTLRGTSIPIVVMPADEFDALAANNRGVLFASNPGTNGVKEL